MTKTQGLVKLGISVKEAEFKNQSSAELRYCPVFLTNPLLNNAGSPARPGFCVGKMLLTAIQKA